MAGDFAIEIKVKGSFTDVARQIHRYALSPKVGSIVLVTTRLNHTKFDESILGKPLYVAYVGGGL